MKKIIPSLILGFLLSSAVISAQSLNSFSGTVTYQLVTDMEKGKTALDKMEKENPDLYAVSGKSIRSMLRIEKELQFELQFTAEQSFWQITAGQEPEDFEEAMAYQMAVIMATDAKKSYFIDREKNIRIYQADLNGGLVNIVEAPKKFNWTITENEKCVGGRTLFEATTQEEQSDKNGNPIIKKITAWFTPDIPVSFGPAGYDGLPGLILEVKFNDDQSRGFVATTIEVNRNKEVKPIRKPKAVGEMTVQEFNQYTLDEYKRTRNDD